MPRATSAITVRSLPDRGRLLILLSAAWLPWAIADWTNLSAPRWWIGALFAWYPYVTLGTLAVTIAAVHAHRRTAVAVAAIGLIALSVPQAGRVTRNDQPPVAHGIDVTLMVLNLNRGRADANAVVRLARDYGVDVASLVELTPDALIRLNAAGLSGSLPSQQVVPGAGSGGLGSASRLPANWDIDLLPPTRPWVPTKVSLTPTHSIRVQTIHAAPPRPGIPGMPARELFAQLPGPTFANVPVLIAGDFNATLDNPDLKHLLERGFRDAADERGFGLAATWSALGGLARFPLDHVLVPPTVAVTAVSFSKVPGTDHRAVIVRVRVPDSD